MKRKDYQKPTMQAVQLKHKTHLLLASGEKMRKNDDYENGGDPLEF